MSTLEDKALEKDAEYTLIGSIENAGALFNLDFFERTALDKVRFLGESGSYTLHYYKNLQTVLLTPPEPAYPDFLVATGKGFGYPVGAGAAPAYLGGYPENAAANEALKYVLFRKIANDTYQATIMMKTGSGEVEFKPYQAAGGGKVISSWSSSGEFSYSGCTFSGEANVFVDGGEPYHNWVAGSDADAAQCYRITVTVTSAGDPRAANVSIEKIAP